MIYDSKFKINKFKKKFTSFTNLTDVSTQFIMDKSENRIMTEKENMINGKYYNPSDPDLVADRLLAKSLCFEYNRTLFSERNAMEDIIRNLFGKTSEKFQIEPTFFCDYGYNIEIGNNFYSNHNLVILDCAKVTFGDNVIIGPNCGFYTAIHPKDAKTRSTFSEYAKPIEVGNNVWFGGNVTVLPGVKIGDNCVIGAGSVVTKNISSNTLSVGNPSRVIRYI